MLRPRERLSEESDLVEAIMTVIQEYPKFKNACTAWAAKLRPTHTGELSTAIDGLRRLIASIVHEKASGQWSGWTDEALAAHRMRYDK